MSTEPSRAHQAIAAATARRAAARAKHQAERIPVLLSAIDNALRNGSYMTGANLAFMRLCDVLSVDQDALPPFDPRWAQGDDAADAEHQARLASGETT